MQALILCILCLSTLHIVCLRLNPYTQKQLGDHAFADQYNGLLVNRSNV